MEEAALVRYQRLCLGLCTAIGAFLSLQACRNSAMKMSKKSLVSWEMSLRTLRHKHRSRSFSNRWVRPLLLATLGSGRMVGGRGAGLSEGWGAVRWVASGVFYLAFVTRKMLDHQKPAGSPAVGCFYGCFEL